jgi:nitrilase
LFNLKDRAGQPLYCESEGYLAGDHTVRLSVDDWDVGLATCYDLRFPGFFEALAKSGPLDCLVIPAAFTLQTGMYHWHLLLRASVQAGPNLEFFLNYVHGQPDLALRVLPEGSML